jgi:hypothetical protein
MRHQLDMNAAAPPNVNRATSSLGDAHNSCGQAFRSGSQGALPTTAITTSTASLSSWNAAARPSSHFGSWRRSR